VDDFSKQSLQTILSLLLFFGGSATAIGLLIYERRRLPDLPGRTKTLSDRSWNTRQIFILLGTLFLLYLLVGCSGRFFYEEQIPLMRLVMTVLIYAVMICLMTVFSRTHKKAGLSRLGIAPSEFRLILLAPIVYLAAIPALILVSKVSLLLLTLFSPAEPELQEVAKIVSGEWSWLEILYTLMAVFAAPVYEELLFRGIAFPYCVKKIGLIPAMLLVSLLFGLVHFHLPSFGTLTLLSVVLCLAYWRTGSLWPSIGAHMIFNAITILALHLAR